MQFEIYTYMNKTYIRLQICILSTRNIRDCYIPHMPHTETVRNRKSVWKTASLFKAEAVSYITTDEEFVHRRHFWRFSSMFLRKIHAILNPTTIYFYLAGTRDSLSIINKFIIFLRDLWLIQRIPGMLPGYLREVSRKIPLKHLPSAFVL